MTSALGLYGRGLLTREEGVHAHLRLEDGGVMPLPLQRYTSPADETDEKILRAIRGPVLDVGCGPGRHLHALARRGEFALGVDLSPQAVRLARGGGGQALLGSVFDELPGAGTWQVALLLDGNIGINGTPARLLRRVGALLAPRGQVLVELDPPQLASTQTRAKLETSYGTSGWFPWARVSVTDIRTLAADAGFSVDEEHLEDGRWFARLISTAAPGKPAFGPAALRRELSEE